MKEKLVTCISKDGEVVNWVHKENTASKDVKKPLCAACPYKELFGKCMCSGPTE